MAAKWSYKQFLHRVKWSSLYRLRKQSWYHCVFFRNMRRRNSVKLHIGCGYNFLEGWINIDKNKKVQADLYMDIQEIKHFCPENAVDEIMMIHVISYLRFWEALDFLQDCHRWLRDGGKIEIEVPDINKLARKIISLGSLDNCTDYAAYLECLRAVYAFGLEQITNKEHFETYAFGWSAEHLALEMKKLGFSDIRILEPQCHDKLPWRDFRIEASK